MAGERALPGLGLFGFWTLGSNGWGTQHSEGIRTLSVLTQARCKSFLAAVPGSPVDGDIHVLTAAPNENAIAVRDNGAWVYLTPAEGFLIYDDATNCYYRFNGTSWYPLLPMPSTGDNGKIWAVKSDDLGFELISPPTGGGGGGGGGGAATSIKAVTGDYTLINTDLAGGVILRVDSATAVVITVPTGLSNTEPVTIVGVGLGGVTVTPDVGVTMVSADGNTTLRARYSGATLVRDASNSFILIGDLA